MSDQFARSAAGRRPARACSHGASLHSHHVSVEFLAGVEAAFVREEADLMVSVLPPALPELRSYRLAELKSVLVAQCVVQALTGVEPSA